MSLDVVKEQVEKFLDSEIPEVMAIKGTWGVGKTYTWNKLLQNAKDKKKIKLKKYAYVSLFGINSLEELKYAIFEQSIGVELIGTSPNIDTFKSNANELITSLGKKSVPFIKGIPFVKNFLPAIQSASFLSINKTIVCIDDFERKSKDVNLGDVLGLMLLLKEQRECKMVLIFNDKRLGEEDSDEFKKFREKVIDLEIQFKPTSKECIEIALPSNSELMIQVGSFIEALSINNIRIIKKIEKIANVVYPILNQYEEEVLTQALHTLCLYSLCFYSDDKSIPNYDYVKNIGQKLYWLDDSKDQSDEEKEWNSFLRKYDYRNTDEFDLRIAEAVEKGYIQEDPLREAAEKLNGELIASKSQMSFRKSWELYYDSFSDNREGVVKNLYNSVKENAASIGLTNFNNTVRLFRELDENDLADEIIELFIKAHDENTSIFDLHRYSFADDITDTEIKKRFSQLVDEQKAERTVGDVLAKIAGKNSWGHEDEKILSAANSIEYYQVFKHTTGKNLREYVDVCLRFGRYQDSSEQQKEIMKKAKSALQRIAKENRLNELRVKNFGVSIKEE